MGESCDWVIVGSLVKQSLAVGDPSFRSFDFEDGQAFIRAKMDTLDNLNFPRQGYLNSIEWSVGKEELGAEQ